MSMEKVSDGLSPSSSSTTKDENANGRDTSHKNISNNSTSSNPPGDKKTPTKRCKLVIVGDGCCGKTSLLTVFKRYSALHE